MKHPVFCKDCRHFPPGLRDETVFIWEQRRAPCGLLDIINYVTGEHGHLTCSDKNRDGRCCDFSRLDDGHIHGEGADSPMGILGFQECR